MGKRNSVVILSSSDEDNESSLSSYQSYPKPKSRRPLITRTNSREPKKPRFSGTRSRMSKEFSNVNEVCLLLFLMLLYYYHYNCYLVNVSVL